MEKSLYTIGGGENPMWSASSCPIGHVAITFQRIFNACNFTFSFEILNDENIPLF